MNPLSIIGLSFFSSTIGMIVLVSGRQRFSANTHAMLTGFSAGVMLAASFGSLIHPALQLFIPMEVSFKWVLVTITFLLGAVAMEIIHQRIPHEHEVRGVQMSRVQSIRRGILITSAMALHNLPEGLALGIGALQEDQNLVKGLLLGIAGQNFPEGAMTALALMAAGTSKRAAVLGVLIVGLVEATGAAVGLFAAPMALLSWALIFCGGAMIYVVSQEMIPESHSQGKERIATFSLLAGLVAFGILSYTL